MRAMPSTQRQPRRSLETESKGREGSGQRTDKFMLVLPAFMSSTQRVTQIDIFGSNSGIKNKLDFAFEEREEREWSAAYLCCQWCRRRAAQIPGVQRGAKG